MKRPAAMYLKTKTRRASRSNAIVISRSWPDCWDRPNHWSLSGRFTNWPWRAQRRLSRRITIVARVTTIEGRRRPAMKRPLNAPINAPMRVEARRTSGMDQPAAARSPAQTLQTENCEPTEMSICRQMITRAMPQATTRDGASRVRRERSGWGEKKAGAKMARARSRSRRAEATEISRKWRERNSKFEIRNPKQLRSSKFEDGTLTGLSRFEFRVCFDIRFLGFEFILLIRGRRT